MHTTSSIHWALQPTIPGEEGGGIKSREELRGGSVHDSRRLLGSQLFNETVDLHASVHPRMRKMMQNDNMIRKIQLYCAFAFKNPKRLSCRAKSLENGSPIVPPLASGMSICPFVYIGSLPPKDLAISILTSCSSHMIAKTTSHAVTYLTIASRSRPFPKKSSCTWSGACGPARTFSRCINV